jgi:hypothetical protein
MKFCGECGTPLTTNPSGPPASSHAEITSALSEALEQQRATAELLQTRTRELVAALEQQTATSEILDVISRSPTELQPVFDAIAERAVRLCDALFGSVYRFDGELIHMVADSNYPLEALEASRQLFPTRASRGLFGREHRSLRSEPRSPRFSRTYGDPAQQIHVRRCAALSKLKHGFRWGT